MESRGIPIFAEWQRRPWSRLLSLLPRFRTWPGYTNKCWCRHGSQCWRGCRQEWGLFSWSPRLWVSSPPGRTFLTDKLEVVVAVGHFFFAIDHFFFSLKTDQFVLLSENVGALWKPTRGGERRVGTKAQVGYMHLKYVREVRCNSLRWRPEQQRHCWNLW